MIALAPFLLLAAQDLSEETFAEWRDRIAPSEQELRWRGAGWRPSLWDGVLDGHKSKKPVLLWAMNGHPLGLC
jgi:hypothetical protein